MSNPETGKRQAKAGALQRTLRFAKRLMIFLLIGYMLLVLAMVLMETSMVYPAAKYPAGGNWSPDFPHEDVTFTSADGVECHGWLMPSDVPRATPRYIIYCHGNGENVASSGSWSVRQIVQQLGATAMVFDYRGYGKSEGSPHEAGIKLDAQRALDVFCDRLNIKPKDVILVGHSLGGGVATHLAATKGCKALVLQKTFSSMPDVGASKFPILPVQLLMRNRFESAAAIENFGGPLFQAHGDSDRVVPIRFGEKLFSKKPAHDLDSP